MEHMITIKPQIVLSVPQNVPPVQIMPITVLTVPQVELIFHIVDVLTEPMMPQENVKPVPSNVEHVTMNTHVPVVLPIELNNHYVDVQKELMIMVMSLVSLVILIVNLVPKLVITVFFVLKITPVHHNVEVSQKPKNQLKLNKEL